MDSCVLTPPNSLALSDTAIGNVVARSTWKARGNSTTRGGDTGQKELNPEMKSYQQRYRQAPYHKTVQVYSPDTSGNHAQTCQGISPGKAIFSSTAERTGQTESSSGRKRQSCLSSDLRTADKIIASIQGTNHNITAELQQAIVVEALKKKIRHR